MSDVMLLGVLRMPLPHDPDPLTPLAQFVARARQAADRIEADAERIERLTAERDSLLAAAVAAERRMWRILIDPDAHTYNGDCPDVSDWDRRDPDCPGCAALGDWRATG